MTDRDNDFYIGFLMGFIIAGVLGIFTVIATREMMLRDIGSGKYKVVPLEKTIKYELEPCS